MKSGEYIRKSELDKVVQENEELQKQLDELSNKEEPKPSASKAPAKAKTEGSQESAKAGKVETKSDDQPEPKQGKKKRATCSLKAAEFGMRVNKVVKYLLDHVHEYQDGERDDEILAIYRTKGEKQEIIFRMKKFFSGIHPFGKIKYYRFCVDSGNLTLTKKRQTEPIKRL